MSKGEHQEESSDAEYELDRNNEENDVSIPHENQRSPLDPNIEEIQLWSRRGQGRGDQRRGGRRRFSFSVDHGSQVQTGSPSQVLMKKPRKKSPSDRRRDSQ